MAQTIKDNWPLIEKSSGKVFTRKFVQDLGEVILPLMDTYARLDNKDNPTHDPPTHDDVLDMLEVINVNPAVEELIITGFNVAGPLLMTSIQMLANNALLHLKPAGRPPRPAGPKQPRQLLHTTASTIARPGRGLGSTSPSTKPP
ncbi:unnamed protein product [Porites lobata]|uniref:Uncharacterized protein n=1 Tax=Porites lobata TaxID=104759 RepID=A0ABN8NLV5_9CNID|nr:unnamed protein product [Porites lobata]